MIKVKSGTCKSRDGQTIAFYHYSSIYGPHLGNTICLEPALISIIVGFLSTIEEVM